MDQNTVKSKAKERSDEGSGEVKVGHACTFSAFYACLHTQPHIMQAIESASTVAMTSSSSSTPAANSSAASPANEEESQEEYEVTITLASPT